MDMTYKDMIGYARANGIGTEETMWQSVGQVDKMLELVKEEHPDEYWKFMRKTHASLYGNHYDECWAEYDVSQMHSTDKDGVVRRGAHWTPEEVQLATIGKVFPTGTTEHDKYVAYNAAWHDFHSEFSDEDCMAIAYTFFFADEDWEGEGKVWSYMCAKYKASLH